MLKLINANHRAYKRRGVPHTPRPIKGQQTSKRKLHQIPNVRKHWRDSNDYRRDYFQKNIGLCGIYFCSQCMLAMFRNDPDLEIDHIYPFSRLSVKNKTGTKNTSLFASGLNSTWDCAPICTDCNRNKTDSIRLVTLKDVIAKFISVAKQGIAGLGIHIFRDVWNVSIVLLLKLLGILTSHISVGQRSLVLKRKRFRGGRRFGR